MNKEQLKQTTDFLQTNFLKNSPDIAIILGSGLGPFTDVISDKEQLDYSDIPNFPQATVKGHDGVLTTGRLGNTNVLVFKGRFHAYEGHDLNKVVAPIRLAAKLGVKKVVLTNASGGINSNYVPGDLVYLTDHINLTGSNPLLGKNDDSLGPRFPDMSEPYNKDMIKILENVAEKLEIKIHSGVYAGVLGPTYETPAEINMLRIMGADLVDMSTVYEVIAANHMSLEVSCISCITNYAAGIKNEKLNHADVKDVALKSMDKFQSLLKNFIIELGKND